MKLITVEAHFQPSKLDSAEQHISDQADTVRAMPGCKHYAFYRDPSGERLAIIQHWEDMKTFDAYRSSPTFAALGQGLAPMMASPPVTKVAEIDSI